SGPPLWTVEGVLGGHETQGPLPVAQAVAGDGEGIGMRVEHVRFQGDSHLPEVRGATRANGFPFRGGQTRQQQGSENGNDCRDYQELDERESPPIRHVRTPDADKAWRRAS